MSRKKLRTFDTFTSALAALQRKDKDILGWTRNRTALTHALAVRIKEALEIQESELDVDMGTYVSRSKKVLNPDILVHDRKSKHKTLALVCRNDYLKEDEQEALVNLRETLDCELVMAIAFMPQKSYCLLYRVTGDSIEYYHFDRNTLTADLIRINKDEEKVSSDQLSFGKMK